MILLLVLRDTRRRRELAAACEAARPGVRCIEADDALQALFAAPLDELDLVVLDGIGAGPLSTGQRMHWRRMAPRARLLLLDPNHADAEVHLRQAVLEGLAPPATAAAG